MFSSYFLTEEYIQANRDKIYLIDPSHRSAYKPLNDIFIPYSARQLMDNLRDHNARSTFCQFIREFYIEAAKQIQNRCSIGDIFLHELKNLNPKIALSISSAPPRSTNLTHLFRRFNHILPRLTDGRIPEDFIEQEWNIRGYSHELHHLHSLPIDLFWCQLSELVDSDGTLRFGHLSSFMKNLLILPHSTAAVERIFSQVTINRTKLRNNLQVCTLNQLLSIS